METPKNDLTPAPGAGAPVEGGRLNEAWWKTNGGPQWLAEIQVRKPTQRHYHQQEAFLQGFFSGLPPVRVLDFGCGFGRQLKNLRVLPKLELYGCDISAGMIASCREYVGDPAFVDERVRLIQPRSRLPWPDGFFDVVLTSEVLIHVDSVDLQSILRELLRVGKSTVLHIENRLTSPSRRENDDHDGCWLHDFNASYADISDVSIETFPHAVETQCVYVVRKPGVGVSPSRGDSEGSRQSAGELAQRREELAAALEAKAAMEGKAAELQQELGAIKASSAVRLAEAAKDLPWVPSLIRAAKRRLEPNGWVEALPVVGPALTRPKPELPWGNVAAAASRPSVDAFVSEQPKLIAVCHPDWRGIRAATYGQVDHVLEIPEIESRAHCDRLIQLIRDCGTRKVVVNGFPPEMETFVSALHEVEPDVAIDLIFHGTPAQAHHREDLVIKRMLELADAGAVHKLGFVKSGLAEYFRTRGYAAEHVMNRVGIPMRAPGPTLGSDGKLHIGIFAPNDSHKNLETQVLAALLVPGSVVHVSALPPMAYLGAARDRVRAHGLLPRAPFLELLGTMQAVLCVSLAECYPMTVLEAIASGVICLTSHTSAIFDDAPELFQQLVVTAHDNPHAIAKKLGRALSRREELVLRAQAFVAARERVAADRWNEFLWA